MIEGLTEKVVVVTRSEEQSKSFSILLENRGAEVIPAPMVKFIETDAWQECDSVLDSLSSFVWLVFTSVNGVRFFLKRVQYLKLDVSTLDSVSIAAVGEATSERLQQAGLSVDLIPVEFSAQGLVWEFSKDVIEKKKILLIQPEGASAFLQDKLSELGAEVKSIAVYRTVGVEIDEQNQIRRRLQYVIPDILTFTSPSTARNFFTLFGYEQIQIWLRNGCQIAAIGPVTQKAIESFGFAVDILPDKSTIEALVQKMEESIDAQPVEE